MKTLIFSILQASVIIAITSCASVETTDKNTNSIANKVIGKNYTIDVRMAGPMRSKTIPLSYGYELKIKADSAYAYLPYFGVAHSVALGNTDGGIKFDEPIRDYTITSNKKNNGWDISFKVNSRDYDYRINLNIFNNGSTSFTVNSTDRDMISFTGEVKE